MLLSLLTAPAAVAALAAPHPGDFVRTIDNPWYPLRPGSTYRYRGHDEGTPVADVLHVTHRVKRIQGVPTTVVRDRVITHGRVIEDTRDFYAQDVHGTVWYFGENTKTLRNGKVTSTKGSWAAGRDGASAGIVMEAHPKVGDTYSQEDAPGVAEDRGKVLSLDAAATVPYGTFTGLLKTKDFSPLEPAVVEHKFFLRGVGSILEKEVRGGTERLALVKVVRP
jgi:hypothetical protein